MILTPSALTCMGCVMRMSAVMAPTLAQMLIFSPAGALLRMDVTSAGEDMDSQDRAQIALAGAESRTPRHSQHAPAARRRVRLHSMWPNTSSAKSPFSNIASIRARPAAHRPRHGRCPSECLPRKLVLCNMCVATSSTLRIVISFGKLQVSSHCTSMAVRLYHDNHQQCQCPWQCRGTAAVTLCNMWRVQQHEHRVIYSNRDTVRVRVALHRSDLRASAAGGAPNEDIAASV